MNLERPYKYKMTLSYDGSAYHGWQRQPNGLSIQQVVEEALVKLFRKRIPVISSSRTDAGVHALEQSAHFCLAEETDTERLLFALNGMLPKDIRVKEILSVPSHFHARFCAKKKIYHYHLHCEPFSTPFNHGYSHHVRKRFNPDLVRDAIPHFVGTHNFKAFANENEKGAAKTNPVKTIYSLKMVEQPGGYRLEFEGDGFLYKMVRNIVGTLLACASGKICPSSIPTLISLQDRRKIPMAAPAQGLFLVKVFYE